MKEPNQSIDEFHYFLKACHGIKNQSKVANRTNKQTNKQTNQTKRKQSKQVSSIKWNRIIISWNTHSVMFHLYHSSNRTTQPQCEQAMRLEYKHGKCSKYENSPYKTAEQCPCLCQSPNSMRCCIATKILD